MNTIVKDTSCPDAAKDQDIDDSMRKNTYLKRIFQIIYQKNEENAANAYFLHASTAVWRQICFLSPFFLHYRGKLCRTREKSTKSAKKIIPKRQIYRRLRTSVAISGLCRYMQDKKIEKNLEIEKQGRTFAPAKTNNPIINN